MKIASEYSDGRLAVYLAGELDHHSAKMTVSGIAESIDRYLPRDLVLDLTQLGFMDSSGIAVIVRSYKKMRDAGGRMYIENPQPQPLKVLDASGIDRMIPIAAKRDMTVTNYIKLEFPSCSSNESFARAAAAGFAAQLDPTLDELGDIKTSVSEAVTNCIVHAYPDSIGTITMRLRILDGEKLEITIRDKGRGISDLQQAMLPMYTTGGEERSGMGFTIMESFMDKLKVKSAPGKGTTVTMLRTIRQRRAFR